MIHPTSIGRRDLIERAGGYDPNLLRCQDMDLWRKMSSFTTFANISEILYIYHVPEGKSLIEKLQFAQNYAFQVHYKYACQELGKAIDVSLYKNLWNIRFPLKNNSKDSVKDSEVFNAMGLILDLFREFQKRKLTNQELSFIVNDVWVWISKMISTSQNFLKYEDIFLEEGNSKILKKSKILNRIFWKSCFPPLFIKISKSTLHRN